MATKIFGVEIQLLDNNDPIITTIPLTAIGYSNRIRLISSTVNVGSTLIYVGVSSAFRAGDVVTLRDTAGQEEDVIASVDIGAGTVTLLNPTVNGYATSLGATLSARSVFRWVQNTVDGLTGNWVTGVIYDKGIERWKKSITLDRGGNLSDPSSGSITVKNTDKFWSILNTNSISLIGCDVKIYEFIDTTPTLVFSGECQQATWDSKTFKIPIQRSHQNRLANITKQITRDDYPNILDDLVDKCLPVTFGELRPKDTPTGEKISIRNYAKALKVANQEVIWNTDQSVSLSNILPARNDTFVFKTQANDTTFNFWLGDSCTSYDAFVNEPFIGKYIKVVEGTNNTGVYRRITGWQTSFLNYVPYVILQVNFPFESQMDSTNWIKIVDMQREFVMDSWQCENFIDSSGNNIKTRLELYCYDSKFYRLPPSLQLTPNLTNTTLEVTAEIFEGDPDTVNAYVFSTVDRNTVNPFAPTDAPWNSLAKYTGVITFFSMNKYAGIFTLATPQTIAPGNIEVTEYDAPNWLNLNTGDFSKEATAYIRLTHGVKPPNVSTQESLGYFIEFDMPDAPQDFEFDTVYLGCRTRTYSDCQSSTAFMQFPHTWLYLMCKRIVVNGSVLLNLVSNGYGTTGNPPAPDQTIYDDLPDGYYDTNVPSTYSTNFYLPSNTHAILNGYKRYPITGITNMDQYSSYRKACFGLQIDILTATYPTVTDFEFGFSELCIIFKRSVKIKDVLYTPFRGRVFGDTKYYSTGANVMMQTPRDIFLHICRLQNWSRNSSLPVNGWGLGYATGALIKTSGEGSFNATDAEFVPLKDTAGIYRCSRQITDYKDAYTDALKRSMCRDFFLGAWVDTDGYECIKRIRKYSDTTGLTTLTLYDIIDRKQVKVQEQSINNIFCEPFVRYNRHPDTGDFQSQIYISNVSAPVFDSSYVKGLDPAAAEHYWNLCRDIWKVYHIVAKPPSDMTDKEWFNDPTTSDAMAQDYLEVWIEWMHAKKITFRVHYDTPTADSKRVADWNECQKFVLNLPHQTAGLALKCIVTSISPNPNPPYDVEIVAITFDEVPQDFNLQKVMTTLDDAYMWSNDPSSTTGEVKVN